MFKQIALGLLLAGVWGVIAFYSQQISDAFGKSAWAEAHLGSTKSMYALVGFVLVMIGFLFMFGVIPVTSPVDTAAGM